MMDAKGKGAEPVDGSAPGIALPWADHDGPILPPAAHPCASCPYRRDVPSGVWSAEDYTKLPLYDQDTGYQPTGVFLCHQNTGHACAGWAGCHDGAELLALRVALADGRVSVETAQAICDYESPVPLFDSGSQAAAHGLRDLACPSPAAREMARDVAFKRLRRYRLAAQRLRGQQ